MKHSTGYRKVLLFAFMAAACVAMALADKISGDAALAAISTAFASALGLNIMEHRRGVGAPPALPAGAMPTLPRAARRSAPAAPREDFPAGEPTEAGLLPPGIDLDTLARALVDQMQARGR